MAEITAALVKDLREKTGAGMMDCKKALAETQGDFEKAIDFLRQKGLASAAKKGGRVASEGAVSAFINDSGKVGVLVEINCETDFVAKNDDFRSLSSDIAKHIAEHKPENVAQLMEQKHGANTVQHLITEKVAKIGENIVVRRFARYETNGVVASYIHAGGKIGVLVELEGASKGDAVATDVAMHIAAAAPVAVRREEVPTDILDREREVYKQQAIEQGKPANIAEKMVAGRVEKYYKEACLIDQPFVKNPDQTVSQLLGKVMVKRFTRFQLGEGIDKKQDDFASEVAKMAGTK